jgi:hypothetical protein
MKLPSADLHLLMKDKAFSKALRRFETGDISLRPESSAKS